MFEKILNIMAGLAVVIVISFFIFMIWMVIQLCRYKECNENGFKDPYCENYRDF